MCRGEALSRPYAGGRGRTVPGWNYRAPQRRKGLFGL